MSGSNDMSSDTIMYCPGCAVDYEFCNGYRLSQPATHIHKPIVLRTHASKAPADFWEDIAASSDNDRACDSCGDLFSSRVDLHACCASCHDCNFCGDCLIDRKADFSLHHCGRPGQQPKWDYFVFEGVNEAYYHQQMGLAEAEKHRIQREKQEMLLENSTSGPAGGSRGALRRRTPSSSSDESPCQPQGMSSQSSNYLPYPSLSATNRYSACRPTDKPAGGWFSFGTSAWDICF